VTTEDEVMRLLRRADPDRDRADVPSVDGTEYLAALRTRSSNVDYLDTEPTPTEPPTNHHRWLSAAAAAATVTVIAGGLVLAARDDDETGVVTDQPPVTEGPVTTPPAWATTPAIEDPGTRVGFIGLPPEGATPSTPEGGELVVSIRSCVTPTGEPSEIDTLPPLGSLWVLADGRLIWLKYEDLPEGANSLSTGLLEQRLTPEGVELMRSEATAAISSGEPHRCGPRDYTIVYVPDGGDLGDLEAKTISADDEHLARVIDPSSWLPATAWEDREIRAYVPSTYLVMFVGEPCVVDCIPPESGDTSPSIPIDTEPSADSRTAQPAAAAPVPYTAQLPAAVVDLIDTKVWEENGGLFYATFTTDEARTLAAALDDAGLEQDGLLNAYQLDYQYEYHDEYGDTVMHIVFNPFAAAGAVCEGGGFLCRPGL
jgi:hypothetical protein